MQWILVGAFFFIFLTCGYLLSASSRKTKHGDQKRILRESKETRDIRLKEFIDVLYTIPDESDEQRRTLELIKGMNPSDDEWKKVQYCSGIGSKPFLRKLICQARLDSFEGR